MIMTSTEIFTVGESTSWTYAARLPRPMDSVAYASLNNKIYFIGKLLPVFCYNNWLIPEDNSPDFWTKKSMVVEFDGENWNDKFEWNDYGDIKKSAAVAVDLATSGFKDFCN